MTDAHRREPLRIAARKVGALAHVLLEIEQKLASLERKVATSTISGVGMVEVK